MVGHLGADLETSLRACLLLPYESSLRCIRVGHGRGLVKYDLELFVDLFKTSLQIGSGSLNKFSVTFEALGGDGGFATNFNSIKPAPLCMLCWRTG